MKSIALKRKKLWIGVLASSVVATITISSIAWSYHKDNISLQTKTKCSDYPGGFPVWPDSLSTFTDDSYGVIVGKILNPEEQSIYWSSDSPPLKLRITDALKGKTLHQGDIIEFCSNTGPVDIDNNRSVLIFLDGKNHNLWVPLQGDIGIIVQSKDGRFKRGWGDNSKTSATISELYELIK